VLPLSYLPLVFAAVLAHHPVPDSGPAAHLAVAACHRSTASACAVVNRTDVVQALGLAVEKGEEETDGSASTCGYARRRGRVSVTLQRLQGKLDLEAEMASLKASVPGATIREAPGLGTRAFFLDIPGAGTQLYVIRGDSDFLMISVLGFGEAAQTWPAADAMARAALGRL
jgi:hypothetical protein